MNPPYPNRHPPGPRTGPRPPDRRRAQDLLTRLGRARLVYLLSRSGTPLTDWVPLCLALALLGLMSVAGPALGVT